MVAAFGLKGVQCWYVCTPYAYRHTNTQRAGRSAFEAVGPTTPHRAGG